MSFSSQTMEFGLKTKVHGFSRILIELLVSNQKKFDSYIPNKNKCLVTKFDSYISNKNKYLVTFSL